ncbi:MAG: O-antigen ligase family protein [Microthrixaceae bacterium]
MPTIWVTVCPLVLMVGTEYKFRHREVGDSLSGAADPTVLLELGLYAAVLGYLLLFVLSPPRLRRPTAILFVMRAYAATMFVSVAYGTYPTLGAVRGAQLLVMVTCAGAIAGRATRAQMVQLARGFVILVAGSAVLGIWFRVPYSHLQADRFSWFYVHPVTAGAMLALALVLTAGLLGEPPRRSHPLDRWLGPLSLVLMAGMSLALLETRTRGALFAAIPGLALVGYLSTPRRNRLPLAVLGGVATIIPLWLFAGPIYTFLARGESAANLATVSNRTELWSIAFDLVRERPLIGWGLATSRGIFYKRVGLGGAHNALVNVLVDGGLVGAGLWLALIGAIIVGIVRLSHHGHRDVPVLSGLLLTLMVNGLTVEGVGSGIGMSALWLLLLGAWVCVDQREVASALVGRPHAQPDRTSARSRVLETSGV